MKKGFLTMVAGIGLILSAFNGFAQTAEVKPAPVGEKTGNFVLKVGFFEFPGLTYTDEKGKPAGLVNEITIKTLENAKIKYTIESLPAARFYEYLSSGKIHLFNGLNAIQTVKDSTISSPIELFPLEMRVYWVGDKPAITAKEDLVGHTVILVRGFSYKDWGAWIRDANNKVPFQEANSHEAAFEMLKRGRGDYLLNYRYIDSSVLEKVQIPNLTIKTLFKWSCFFNVYKGTPDAQNLLKKIEDSYQQLIKEGKLKKYE